MADLNDLETPERFQAPLRESIFKSRKGKFISEKNFQKNLATVKAKKAKRKLNCDRRKKGLSRSTIDDIHNIDIEISPRKKRKQEHQVKIPCIFYVMIFL